MSLISDATLPHGDDVDSELSLPRPKRQPRKSNLVKSRPRGNLGRLEQIINMPLEIFAEVSGLWMPVDQSHIRLDRIIPKDRRPCVAISCEQIIAKNSHNQIRDQYVACGRAERRWSTPMSS